MSDDVKDVLFVKELISEDTVLNGDIKTDQIVDNGTQAISITNVGPAGVGTATISKWLLIKTTSGAGYYLPMFT